MSIDFTKLQSLAAAPYQSVTYFKTSGTASNVLSSSWLRLNLQGVAPTTAVAPTNTTAGAMGQVDSSGTQRIVGAEFAGTGGLFWIIDRLSHQGGLDATVTTAQTTNLPTAALTRYTGAVGVYAALEIYSQIGATSTTVSVSYTNSAGAAGQISPLIAFGNTSYREVGRFLILPLVAGDVGVKSVESVTVTATTGTAGAFGVTLFKFLSPIIQNVGASGWLLQMPWNPILNAGWVLDPIVNGACLSALQVNGGASSVLCGGNILFGED